MIILHIDEVISLHSRLISKTGGTDGLRDPGMLESALYGALGGFGDEDIYPTIEEKAARLMYALVSNHAFVDGNKRIGVLIMLMTLRLNDISISYTQKELIQLGLSVADGTMKYESILVWIQNHKS